MRKGAGVALAVLAAVAGMQLVTVERTNPPVTEDLDAPAPVGAVLRRACYDCHSNETRWPWYSRVAPASWLVARDVREARRHLNFSEWDRVSAVRREIHVESAIEEIAEGHMPLPAYLLLHPAARVTPVELDALGSWFAATYGDAGD